MEEYKFQISAGAVFIIVLVNYFRNRKLPLMSTKIFSVFLILSAANIVFDVATVYTINHIDIVSPEVNRFCHQMFIGLLDVIIYMLFLYVNILANGQKRPNILRLAFMSIPLAFAVVMTIFSPLYYHIGDDGNYSYGSMAFTVYISVIFYMLCITVNLVAAGKVIKKEKKSLIICGMAIWLTVALVQYFNPVILMSSFGNMVMILLVYLSFENPREYADIETGTLNKAAFHQMISEMYGGHRQFWVVSFAMDDVDYIQKVFGHASMSEILMVLNERIKKNTMSRVFHSRSSMISVVTTSKRTVDILIKNGENNHVDWKAETGVEFAPSFHVEVIECPKYARSVNEFYDLKDYLYRQYSHISSVTVIDDKVVEAYQHFTSIRQMVEYAVHNDGFEVFYQPIFSNETHSFASAEALVRLKDTTTLGFVSPEVFIPIAECMGLIKELGNIVFDKVCRFINEQEIEQLGVNYIEVNLSRIQGVDKNLVSTLIGYMEKYNINPKSINLEITETASVQKSDILISNMNSLREYGCHFSMDDFGTGYSNLSQVAKTRFELIKLDKSLIWPCFDEDGHDARIILDNCVRMILNLGVKIVAEGVETREQADKLSEMGVTYLQGYYFSKPVNEELYLQFLKNRN